ncbi:MAG: T9SS type A sorting domain-containing protein [Bacteroidetes bacterium]|nr:T9SS type A sorting domain-containing protein [Bacteroidota bacterium]
MFYCTTGLVSTPARTTESWKCFNITGTDEPSFHQPAIYPNPFNDFLNLPFAGQLEIQDLLGRVLLREQIHSGVHYLNQISNGSYLLKLRSKEKTIIQQIIK